VTPPQSGFVMILWGRLVRDSFAGIENVCEAVPATQKGGGEPSWKCRLIWQDHGSSAQQVFAVSGGSML
jgi:hypothetical protein